ncbi:hypothetical protein OG800_44730 [Streptomyces sp. NBC_00445]|uniref:hypothetical protein n=1 Tax=unclassified Streptomyces TaxID=2593676 RepID=UPI002E1E5229|nr:MULTISPECIES: hypothetical protein [unclassified Streptomyces]
MTDELRPGRAEMRMLVTTLGIDGASATVVSIQAGHHRQGIRLGTDRWEIDEARLLVDFNHGLPLLLADRQQVGEGLGNTVRLWSQEYRIHRQWLWPKLRFTVTAGERTVLRVHERLRRNDGARALDTHSDPALDPVVTLALILLEGRPHKMGLSRGDAAPL